MSNESKELEPKTETSETEVEATESTETEAETNETVEQSEKQVETPEAKLARLERQAKQLRKKLGVEEPVETKKAKSNSTDLDYGQKAFLVANGLKGSEEINLVKTISAETGKSIEAVLESKYFKAELAEMRESRATKEATPSSSKRSTTSARDSVDYWLNKPFKDVPADMRIKVINAREKAETVERKFYNS